MNLTSFVQAGNLHKNNWNAVPVVGLVIEKSQNWFCLITGSAAEGRLMGLDWQTIAAIISAVTTVLAAGIAIYAVRRTLWLNALVALEQRFAQINHAKIADPESWESITRGAEFSNAAKHLVFETFQFYHQAFMLHCRGAIADVDYQVWGKRMERDLQLFSSYRAWWKSEQPKFHTAWDEQFVRRVDAILATIV